jgi:hypothetical protein
MRTCQSGPTLFLMGSNSTLGLVSVVFPIWAVVLSFLVLVVSRVT